MRDGWLPPNRLGQLDRLPRECVPRGIAALVTDDREEDLFEAHARSEAERARAEAADRASADIAKREGELIEEFRKEAKTPEQQQLITDLFEKITLYDLKVTEATTRQQGKLPLGKGASFIRKYRAPTPSPSRKSSSFGPAPGSSKKPVRSSAIGPAFRQSASFQSKAEQVE